MQSPAPWPAAGVGYAMPTAAKVGRAVEAGLRRQIEVGGIWIIAEALGPTYLTRRPGTRRSDWLPDPGSPLVATLIETVRHANLDLALAVRRVRYLRSTSTEQVLEPQVWERVASPAPTGRYGKRDIASAGPALALDR